MKRIVFTTIICAVLLYSSTAFAAQEIKFKDGTMIRGQIQAERLRIKTQFGELNPKVSDVTFVSMGKIELSDGSQVMGELFPEPPAPKVSSTIEEGGDTTTKPASSKKKGLMFKTKYGTFELFFSVDDIEYIDFSK